MSAPAQLYALGLVSLMDRQNVHHFTVDLDNEDPESRRGLALNIDIDGRKFTFSTGKCDCPTCLAKAGATQ